MIRRSDASTLGRELDVRDFSAVLRAWAKSDHPHAGLMAERDLRKMLEMAGQGRFDCLPDTPTFGTVIAALRKSRTPNSGPKSLELLSELEKLGKNNPANQAFQPHARFYLAIIQAVIEDGVGEDVVLELLDEMELRSASLFFWDEAFDRQAFRTINALR